MLKSTFMQYIEDYNSADVQRILAYYVSDIIFENYGVSQRGPAVTDFLSWLHGAVDHAITPRHVLIDANQIAMDADCQLMAKIDLPQLPIGAMHRGERANARMFAFYETRGEKFVHVRVSGWPLIRMS